MKRQKKHYEVYYEGHGIGCYAENYKKIYLGNVWAVSEKQACNFVRFRMKDKNNPHGGYTTNILGDSEDMGMVLFQYKAYEID